jgi:hypothetical protein
VVVFDIHKELSKGNQVYRIADLFPMSVAAESYEYRARKELSDMKASRLFAGFNLSSLTEYCGNFVISEPDVMAKQRVTISKGNNCLNLQLNGGGYYELIPDSPQTFSMLDYGGLDFKCNFDRNANNTVQELFLKGGGITITAKRIE